LRPTRGSPRHWVSAAGSIGPPRSHTRARPPAATGTRRAKARRAPLAAVMANRHRAQARRRAGKSSCSRACSGFTSISRSRRATIRCEGSGMVAAKPAVLASSPIREQSPARVNGLSKAGALKGCFVSGADASAADGRCSDPCGNQDRSRVLRVEARSRLRACRPSQDATVLEPPERQRSSRRARCRSRTPAPPSARRPKRAERREARCSRPAGQHPAGASRGEFRVLFDKLGSLALSRRISSRRPPAGGSARGTLRPGQALSMERPVKPVNSVRRATPELDSARVSVPAVASHGTPWIHGTLRG